MKGCMHSNPVLSSNEVRLQRESNPGPARSVGQRLNRVATVTTQIFSVFFYSDS